MARIIRINPLEPRDIQHLLEFNRTTDQKSIDLTTVRSIARKKCVDAKILRGNRIFATEEVGSKTIPYPTQYEKTPVYLITFEYKIHCDADVFYVDGNEFNRLSDDLARYGWII